MGKMTAKPGLPLMQPVGDERRDGMSDHYDDADAEESLYDAIAQRDARIAELERQLASRDAPCSFIAVPDPKFRRSWETPLPAVSYCQTHKSYDCTQNLPGRQLAGKWQDISTAPKDGTEIIAVSMTGGTGVLVVRWIAMQDFLTTSEAESYASQGMSQSDLECEDWFFADFVHGDRLQPDCYPTHWQPLPEPPKEG